MHILGIVGSLRRDSHNRRLMAAAAALLPPEVGLEVYEGLRDIPAFDQDLEFDKPEPVRRLEAAISRADAVLIATPEYNSSIPGYLKNALDWVSRPLAESPLRNKNVAVIGASTSMFGAVWSQAETRKVLGAIGARVVDRELPIPTAHEQFDERDHLVEPELRNSLADILVELRGEVERQRALVA